MAWIKQAVWKLAVVPDVQVRPELPVLEFQDIVAMGAVGNDHSMPERFQLFDSLLTLGNLIRKLTLFASCAFKQPQHVLVLYI